jgi:F-type H+-transporting ATPase subunit a
MHISLAAEEVFKILGFPVTNSLLMTWLTMLILIIAGFLAGRNLQQVPGKLQNVFEAIFEFFLGLIDSIMQDRALSLKVFPLTCTFLLLIILSNWLGLVPGVGTIGYHVMHEGKSVLMPLLRPTNADFNSTLSWAIISIVSVQFLGVFSLGFFSYFNKFINVKALRQGNFEGGISFSVGILEIFSELSKIISFSFRLFGNVFAGEVLLTVIASLLPFVGPLPFYMLELFVGLIQGIVFVTLTLVFIKIAVTSHDSHHESEAVAAH